MIPIRGPYEGLIILKDSETDQYEGVLAESWEANEDKSVWTFHLREGVTFQDGSPCDAEAVRASYERLLTMQKGAYNVVARFVPDPSHITAPDAKTVVFDLGKPQPLFESAMGATYGVQVVNVKVAMEHEEDGDFGNTWMMSYAEGTGTGPYRITGFEPGEHVSSRNTTAIGPAGRAITSTRSWSARSTSRRRCGSCWRRPRSTSPTGSRFWRTRSRTSSRTRI